MECDKHRRRDSVPPFLIGRRCPYCRIEELEGLVKASRVASDESVRIAMEREKDQLYRAGWLDAKATILMLPQMRGWWAEDARNAIEALRGEDSDGE